MRLQELHCHWQLGPDNKVSNGTSVLGDPGADSRDGTEIGTCESFQNGRESTHPFLQCPLFLPPPSFRVQHIDVIWSVHLEQLAALRYTRPARGDLMYVYQKFILKFDFRRVWNANTGTLIQTFQGHTVGSGP